MSTKEVRNLLNERGYYTYIITSMNTTIRIIDARSIGGQLQVKSLSRGEWFDVNPGDRIENR